MISSSEDGIRARTKLVMILTILGMVGIHFRVGVLIYFVTILIGWLAVIQVSRGER
jgi:hypothetical protein